MTVAILHPNSQHFLGIFARLNPPSVLVPVGRAQREKADFSQVFEYFVLFYAFSHFFEIFEKLLGVVLTSRTLAQTQTNSNYV